MNFDLVESKVEIEFETTDTDLQLSTIKNNPHHNVEIEGLQLTTRTWQVVT
jgi:hypothetical protein